jgi:hypothetical protein
VNSASPTNSIVISAAVEGSVDEAIVRRIIFAGGIPGQVYGKNGKTSLRARVTGYNNSAKYRPWIVLVDLDNDADCAPELCRAWIPTQSPKMCFRIAVHEIEAWLLADRERVSKFLSVRLTQIPIDPESIGEPKQVMVSLASRSRRKAIQQDMVPRAGSGRSVGPAYTSRLLEFINGSSQLCWRPDVAMQSSESLRRCVGSLRRLVLSEVQLENSVK